MDIIELLLLALATTYLTHILLLEQKTSHYGPFQSKDRIVMWEENIQKGIEGHWQPVTLFDWIRRVFLVYRVEKHVWYVDEIRSERWTCPICLSFWIATAVLLLRFFIPSEVFHQVLLLLSLSAVSSILNVNILP